MSFSLRAFLVVFALFGGGSSHAAGSSGIIKVDSVEVLSDGRASARPIRRCGLTGLGFRTLSWAGADR